MKLLKLRRSLLALSLVAALTASAVPFAAAEAGDENIAVKGTPYASVSAPAGAGNKDIGVICDGQKPEPVFAAGDAAWQYDTYQGGKTELEESFGYNFSRVYSLSKLVYQEGIHYDDGGWFADGSLHVEVRLAGEWKAVELTNTPSYPNANDRTSFGDNFESYTFEFKPVLGDAIRIIGTAGGGSTFTSISELEVYGSEVPLSYRNVASIGTPIVSVTEPGGGGNHNINVIRDSVMPEPIAWGGDLQWQYDTFKAGKTIEDWDYFGYTFPREYTFNKLVFQEGCHFDNGGWFAGELYIDVYQNGEWIEVPYTFEGTEYPVSDDNVRDPYGDNFETYTMTFEPVTGTGIRITGQPGGDAMFVGCAELEVYAEAAQGELPGDTPPEADEPGNEDPYNITDEELQDKIAGALAGKMIGVSWGASTEFRFSGSIIPTSSVPEWKSTWINDSFGQDDLYVMVPFIDALADHGVDASVEQVAEYFRDSTFNVFHGNAAARQNLRSGIPASQAGSYLYSQHCDDIDWQIEADFTGVISPGLVNQAIEQAWRLGHIIGYGDGVYGGVFVGAMYARAYTASNVNEIIEAGRQAIPEGSVFRQVIEEVISSHEKGMSWEDTWQVLQDKWANTDRCPGGCDSPFNIDAKMNAAYVLMGLLYGNGNYEESMRIAMRCGDDSDCNPSTVGGILGAYLGLSHIPDQWKSALSRTTKFSCTNYNFDELVEVEYQLAQETLTKCGVEKKDTGYAIDPHLTVTPAALEQWPDQPTVTVNLAMKSLTVVAAYRAFDPNGIESVEWDFGDGTDPQTAHSLTHEYEDDGDYIVTCKVTNKNGNSRTVSTKVSAFENLASVGAPFAAVSEPQGMGSRSLEVMRDGIMPDSGGASDEQYDTWGGWTGEADHEEFYGYTFAEEHTFQQLIFQEGAHFADGGWFKNCVPKVQVRQGEEWVDVTLTEEVLYPISNKQIDFGDGFERFTYNFEPIRGNAIRIIGQAGGTAHYTSIAELIVFEAPKPLNQEAIAAAEAAIRAIPETIDRDCGEVIQAARALVNELTRQEKKALAEGLLKRLEKAEEDFVNLPDPPTYTLGDVNDDGDINASDALLALQHSVKLITLEGDKATAADVNHDGNIDASDALKILQKSVGLIQEF